MSVVLAGAAIVAVETTVAQPARAGTCGDYVRLYQAPLVGPVTGNWIGSDFRTGETLAISRFVSPNHIAPHGNNLRAFSIATYIFTPLNGANATSKFFTVGVDGGGVLRDDRFRTHVSQFTNATRWIVTVQWQACGGAFRQDIGFLDVTV